MVTILLNSLPDLHSLFKDRLCALGLEISINKTRLKKQVLDQIVGSCYCVFNEDERFVPVCHFNGCGLSL